MDRQVVCPGGAAWRQVFAVDRQEPAHARALELEIARRAFGGAQVQRRCAAPRRTRRSACRRSGRRCWWRCRRTLLSSPFHDAWYQRPARGDVGQIDVVDAAAARPRCARCSARIAGMQAQLQDGVDACDRSAALDLGQAVEIPRIEHQRLLADRVGVRAQREAHMRVVQVVGRADRDVVDAARRRGAACRRGGRSARTRRRSARRENSCR